MATIKCGNCTRTHASVATVKACHKDRVHPCGWLVETFAHWFDEETGESESWPVTVECGADATFTDRGWSCAAGHEHVTMQARRVEGWDYAESYGEAHGLAFAGVEPRTMDGHVVTSRQDFAGV